jgi:hypothetical protein
VNCDSDPDSDIWNICEIGILKIPKEIGEMGRDKRKGREQRKRSEREQAGKGPGARSTQYYLITLGTFYKM